MRIVSPPPGVASATSAPSIASTKPRATESPRPTPSVRCGRRGAANGSNRRSRCSAGTPGPWSAISSFALPAPANARDLDRASAAVAQRVVEQVGEHALEQPGVGEHERQVVGHVDVDARRRAGEREQRRADDLVERDRPRPARSARRPAGGSRRAGWRRPRRGGRPSPRSSPAARSRSSVGPGRRRSAQGRHAGLDPGQRRAQVMADRREQRRALGGRRPPACAPRRACSLRRRPSKAVCAAAAKACSTRWSSANSAGPRPTSRRSWADRHVEAQRLAALLRRPAARSTSAHSPLAWSRAFSDDGLHAERARARGRGSPRSVSCSSRSAPASADSVSACALASSAARARRAASSSAPLTTAATTTNTTSATAWSACATSSVCGGSTKK